MRPSDYPPARDAEGKPHLQSCSSLSTTLPPKLRRCDCLFAYPPEHPEHPDNQWRVELIPLC